MHEAHIANCAACAAERAIVARAAEVVRTLEPGPSEEARDAVARAFRRAAAALEDTGELDVSWLTAVPIGTAVGLRTAALGDRMVRWEDDELRLDAYLHPGVGYGRFDITGQVLRGGCEPAVDVEVTLYLDRRAVGATRTDPFGEFSLQPGRARHRAERIGLRLRGSGPPRHVELWCASEASA